MSTKILGTQLEENDSKFLFGACKNAKERRIIKSLLCYQHRQIKEHGLFGIDSCKQLHGYWIQWLTSGCKENEIRHSSLKHGFKAQLRYAQVHYVNILHRAGIVAAKKWRELVTLTLRAYQVCGPSQDEMKQKWVSSLKEAITQPNDRLAERAIRRAAYGFKTRYTDEEQKYADIQDCVFSISAMFDHIEQLQEMGEEVEPPLRPLTEFVPVVEVDDFNLLLKAGPHKVNGKTLTSIFGQAIDVHALNMPIINDYTSTGIPVCDNGEERSHWMTVLHDRPAVGETYMDYVDKLNKEILGNFQDRRAERKVGPAPILYNPLRPVGQIPDNIEAAPGRIVLLQDKAGKTRSIAIATYTMNAALAPLHKAANRLLEKFKYDCTDQDKAQGFLLEWTKEADGFLSSADLTMATDKIPVSLAAYILYRILRVSRNPRALQIASCWYVLMSSLRYRDPVTGELIQYGTGQGMGIYTSWTVGLALFNHTMNLAAWFKALHQYTRRSRQRVFLRYLVCGDDTFNGCKPVFELYEKWMNAIDVPINRAKSHICESSDPIKIAEFCKKLYVNGEIISGMSPKILIRAARDKSYVAAAMSCLHDIVGPLSHKRLAKLVGHKVCGRKLTLPFRYGGWGQKDHRSLHEVLLEDNFIYLYIYKMMRSVVSSLSTKLAVGREDFDQRELDALASPQTFNPYRVHDMDWKLMGTKAYTPISYCEAALEPYEEFLLGKPYNPTELIDMVREVLTQLAQHEHKLLVSSSEVTYSKSELAIRYQRMYTRAANNLSSGNVHTFSRGVAPICIQIDWETEYVLSSSKELVDALDALLFDSKESPLRTR